MFQVGLVLFSFFLGSYIGCSVIRFLRGFKEDAWADCIDFLKDEGISEKELDSMAQSFHETQISSFRSTCMSCGAVVPLWNNIPIISWFLQRGKALCCGGQLSLVYPVAEIITPVLALAAIGLSDSHWLTIFLFFAFVLMFVMSLIDFFLKILPDQLTILLMLSGLLGSASGILWLSLESSIAGMLVGYLSFEVLRVGFRLIRGYEGLGQGDSKLMMALGVWLGPFAIPYIAGVAAITGLLVIGILAIGGTKTSMKMELPFGPFLNLGGLICFVIAASNHQMACQIMEVCR